MSVFFETELNIEVPARYRDARSGLLVRILDVTETELPDRLVTTEIGDGLYAALTWGPVGVTDGLLQTWGVSTDEALTTATSNVTALPVERSVRDVRGAAVDVTVGHPWVSSLIVDRAREEIPMEGFLVAMPRVDVLVTTPVTGLETVDGFETLIGLCESLYRPVIGISPHVWWRYHDNYWRVTDRTDDGSIDFLHSQNVCAFHLMRTLEHLAQPCAECGRG